MSGAPIDLRTPVIVGAGQVVHRPEDGGSPSPIELSTEALRRAADDAGTGERLLRRADSIGYVATTSWLYRDEGALVADALGVAPRQTVRTSQFGGDGPQRLVGETARAIADGELDVALLAGAEAIATIGRLVRSGERPAWPEQPDGAPTVTIGVDRVPASDAESAVSLLAPVNVYALLECAVRARLGESRADHGSRIAELWSRFSEVASGNPYAWLPRRHSAEEISARGSGNRAVSEPYTKLLSANIHVDQAAALIICSAEAARAAGVPEERWVFPLASSFATDEWFVSERDALAASPAIEACGTAVLHRAGLEIDEVEHVDLYSCFPAAVQIAAAELGIPLDAGLRPPTVTGGLTFGGGPGNNYSLHAVATLVGRLRDEPTSVGLSSALGWYATKHAYGLYSGTPPSAPFRQIDASSLMRPAPARPASAERAGPATLEAYTVGYGRDGQPEAVIVSALAGDGTRVLARSTRPDEIDEILDRDPLGRQVTISPGAETSVEVDPTALRA